MNSNGRNVIFFNSRTYSTHCRYSLAAYLAFLQDYQKAIGVWSYSNRGGKHSYNYVDKYEMDGITHLQYSHEYML